MRKTNQSASESNFRIQIQTTDLAYNRFEETGELFKTSSMNLPMQDHEMKLNLMLQSLRRQLELDEKDLHMLRPALLQTSYDQSGQHGQLSQGFVEDMADVTLNLRKLCDIETSEQDKLRKQIDQLRQEKNKLQQGSNVLDHQIGESERVLGIGKDGFKTI